MAFEQNLGILQREQLHFVLDPSLGRKLSGRFTATLGGLVGDFAVENEPDR
ncbi:hypothetical protein D3C76_1779630 [compost metagenome]